MHPKQSEMNSNHHEHLQTDRIRHQFSQMNRMHPNLPQINQMHRGQSEMVSNRHQHSQMNMMHQEPSQMNRMHQEHSQMNRIRCQQPESDSILHEPKQERGAVLDLPDQHQPMSVWPKDPEVLAGKNYCAMSHESDLTKDIEGQLVSSLPRGWVTH